MPVQTQRTVSTGFTALLLAAMAAGTAGYWGPWVNHRAVALILIGQDLGEFVKFLPEARSGALPVVRQLFYLPPFCTCCLLTLLAASAWSTRHGGPALRCHWAICALCLAAIPPISLALLPPVFSVPVLMSEEFRLQVIGALFCLALVPGVWLIRRLPPVILMLLIGLCGLLGAAPAVWQFSVILPAVQNVYGAPLQPGWGMFATGLGFAAVGILGLARAARLMSR